MAHFHPTAVVDPRAKLADDVSVGPCAVIGEHVELAPGVEIGPHAVVTGRTSIGRDTRVFPFAALGGEPQIRGYAGEPTALVIGERNVIREHVAIHLGSPEGVGRTSIGDDNLIMNHVHVAHDCVVGSHCELASYAGLGGHVELADHVVLGGKTGVHQHVRIGESAFAGGNSMLAKDAPPFSRVAGDRARFVGLNTLGLTRRGFAKDAIAALKHAMHLIFQSRLLLEPALERAEGECGGSREVARLIRFLRQSERGFIR
jgi:UDP-N-acetylglucosamine acyltransferase